MKKSLLSKDTRNGRLTPLDDKLELEDPVCCV